VNFIAAKDAELVYSLSKAIIL